MSFMDLIMSRLDTHTQPQDSVQERLQKPSDARQNRSHEPLIDSLSVIEAALDLAAQPIKCDPSFRSGPSFDISIIVPVFNERETLPKVISRIEEVMPPSTQLIVVDDGSTDGTAQWLAGQTIHDGRKFICRRRNRGKGSAVRLGIKHSRGRVVAIQDADLEYDPTDLISAIRPILAGDADVVYGSRYLGETKDPSLLHRVGNRVLTDLCNSLTGLRLTDMETCHKAFRGDLIREIPLRECRFGFEPEITSKLAARGIEIHEVPTGYDCRGYDDGKKIGWKDAVAALVCMWRYRNG